MKFRVHVIFYDLRSSKKALNEISYNFEKLLNIFEKGKFSVMFANSANEIFEKFCLIVKLSENAKLTPVLQFIDMNAEIEKVFIYQEKKTQSTKDADIKRPTVSIPVAICEAMGHAMRQS